MFCFRFFGSAKTDSVRFKWGFGEGRLKDKCAFFELIKILYLKASGENCLQNAHFYKQKGPCLKTPSNWTRSVFPLLTFVIQQRENPKSWHFFFIFACNCFCEDGRHLKAPGITDRRSLAITTRKGVNRKEFLQKDSKFELGDGKRLSIILNPPGCHTGPKFLETCFEVLETSFWVKRCTNFPKICANFPKICWKISKNTVTRFLNNFRIYGTPPSPGVYNDTSKRCTCLLTGACKHCYGNAFLPTQNQKASGQKTTKSAFSKRALHSNVPSNLVPSTFLKHFRRQRGCPWYGPSAPPGRHFAIRTLGYKRAFGAGTRYFFGHFWAFLGQRGGTRVAPGTVPLRNPKGTSRKACLENPDKRPRHRGFEKSAEIGHGSSAPTEKHNRTSVLGVPEERSCRTLIASCRGKKIDSVQSRCIVKGEAQKSPLFWRFSGGFCFSQDRLFSRNSTRKPLNLIKSPICTNAPCKTACLYNAPSMHTLEKIEDKLLVFSNFSGTPGNIPPEIPGYPAKKFGFHGFRGTYRTIWPPHPSRGRPPPHPKISGPKSLGLGSFFLPDLEPSPSRSFVVSRSVGIARNHSLAIVDGNRKWQGIARSRGTKVFMRRFGHLSCPRHPARRSKNATR